MRLFFIMDDIDFASYADDNTPYTVRNNMEDVIFKLQNLSQILFQYFMDHQVKANPDDKCDFICSTNDTVNLVVENQIIDNSKCEKVLGVKLNYKLTFNAHIDDIPYMDFNRKRLLVSAFFISQLNYCTLICICIISQEVIKQIEYMEHTFAEYIMTKNNFLNNFLNKDKFVFNTP